MHGILRALEGSYNGLYHVSISALQEFCQRMWGFRVTLCHPDLPISFNEGMYLKSMLILCFIQGLFPNSGIVEDLGASTVSVV